MSIAPGPLSWQTIGDNFVCLTILIDLEEIPVVLSRFPHYVNEFLSFTQSCWHVCLILYFTFPAVACT